MFCSGIDLKGVTEGLVTFRFCQIWPNLVIFRQKCAKIKKWGKFKKPTYTVFFGIHQDQKRQNSFGTP